MAIEQRLIEKIIPEPNSGCWIWTGAINKGGYGRFNYHGKIINAHRASYKIFKCDVPKSLDVDHLCRVRCCVNPDHLEPVTRQINCRRGLTGHASGKSQASKTLCPRGHEYSLENTYFDRKGSRHCKICRRQARNKWASRHRSQLADYCRAWRQLPKNSDYDKRRRLSSQKL